MISQIESDKAHPSYKALFAIAERLEVPLENLLNDVDVNLEYKSKYTLANALKEAKEYPSAIVLDNELLETPRIELSQSDILFKLGECHLNLVEIDLAETIFTEFAEKAISLLPFDHPSAGKAHRVLAIVYFENSNREKGRPHLEMAMHIFEKHDLLAQMNEIALQLCHHLEECGQTNEAFHRLETLYVQMMKKLEERGIRL